MVVLIIHQLRAFLYHRDYHDYQAYLYAVSDEGASSLQIIDMSTLPDSVSLVYDSSDLFVLLIYLLVLNKHTP